MPTLKEKLMAAKAEGEIRIAASRDYSGREEASLLIEVEVAAEALIEKVKEKKPKTAKPKAEKKPSSKSKKQSNG